MERGHDRAVRAAAFRWLEEQTIRRGDVLPRALLQEGFRYQGERIPLVSPRGIFKPRILDLPLSITTAPNGPYPDRIRGDGTLAYRYRGTDPDHPDNVGLRAVMRHRLPLVYFLGVVPGEYFATWPVFLVQDDPPALTFTVQVDDPRAVAHPATRGEQAGETDARRRYVTGVVQRRMHQAAFRERVIRAYRRHCAMCRLHHEELLEAAHIIPDRDPAGEPVVSNGLSLCRLHHAAFDRNILGVRPDYVIEVRHDILEEEDGPMLRHGLQDLHGRPLARVPRSQDLRPDPERLARRYEEFRAAG